MTELERLAAALDAASAGGGVPVLATLTSVEGSAYRAPGARMVVREGGATVGAISGGCLEKDVAAHAEQVRAALRPRLIHYDLTEQDDAPWGLGMGCAAKLGVVLEPCVGGAPAWLREAVARAARRETAVVVVSAAGTRLAGTDEPSRSGDDAFTDVMPPPLLVAVCGDGPDTVPLLALAEAMGWVARPVRKDEELPRLDARSAAVVMTHNYPRDLALLGALLGTPARYIGVLGPRRRTERLLNDLAEGGVHPQPAQLARLFAPVGLDIGAEAPEEIALAILAEVRAAFAGRPGGRLRERPGPIHRPR